MTTMEEQIRLMDEILEFNTKVCILGQKPTEEEISKIKPICKKFEGYKFDTDVDDLNLIKQIAKFGNSYKDFK